MSRVGSGAGGLGDGDVFSASITHAASGATQRTSSATLRLRLRADGGSFQLGWDGRATHSRSKWRRHCSQVRTVTIMGQPGS
jgi:hypothetical protein